MANEKFNKLVNMGKQITDFATDGDKQVMNQPQRRFFSENHDSCEP